MAKNKTKFLWQSTVYCKNQLVHAIVTDYAEQHYGITCAELKKVFPDELQGGEHHGRTKYDVFDTCDNIHAKDGQGKAPEERYYMKPDEIICLQDGTNIAVCREWNINNTRDFVKHARTLGYHIECVENPKVED